MQSQSLFEKTPMQLLVALLVLMGVLALGAYAQLTFKKANESSFGPATINVTGIGEVLAVPDIGNFTFSVQAEGENATEAQDASARDMNAIIAYLTEQGVEEKDIKTTNYNLNPQYRYEERVCPENSFCPPGERVLDGYMVSQSVSVKVRDTEQSGVLISGVGERGATNISSLYFTIDDEDAIKAEARSLAIADAKQKALTLAKDLGVRVVRIANYHESTGDYPVAYGLGGAERMAVMDEAAEFAAPSVPTGENTTTVQVVLVLEVR